jgi:hypothetical protein
MKEIEDCDLRNKTPDLTRTLTGDGWDNVAGTHVIAYHDCTPKGAVFINATDTTGVDTMNADWTFQDVEKRIIAQPPNTYGAIVFDSPSVNQAMKKKVEQAHPEIAAFNCVTHQASLEIGTPPRGFNTHNPIAS